MIEAHIRPDLDTLAEQTGIDMRGQASPPPNRFTLTPEEIARLRDHIRALANHFDQLIRIAKHGPDRASEFIAGLSDELDERE